MKNTYLNIHQNDNHEYDPDYDTEDEDVYASCVAA